MYSVLSSSNVVINKIVVDNPVTAEVAEQLITNWNTLKTDWINNGKIGEEPQLEKFWIIPPGHFVIETYGNIGEIWNGTNFVPNTELIIKNVPESISDRQFFQGCALYNLITQSEALEAVKTGTLPTTLAGFINQLPVEQRFSAEMLLSGATIFERSNPHVDAFGQLAGMTSDQLDDFWIFCSTL